MVTARKEKRVRQHDFGQHGSGSARPRGPEHEPEIRPDTGRLDAGAPRFFEEPTHLDFLRDRIFPTHPRSRILRVWSAASSSGEEAYTIAMMLAEHLPDSGWEVIGTDVAGRALEWARSGLYPIAAAGSIPQTLLRKYCMKGRDEYEGYLRIGPALRSRVVFMQGDLLGPVRGLGVFDAVFLRNAMARLDADGRREFLRRVHAMVRPGGHLFTGHSEFLGGPDATFEAITPSILRRVHAAPGADS